MNDKKPIKVIKMFGQLAFGSAKKRVISLTVIAAIAIGFTVYCGSQNLCITSESDKSSAYSTASVSKIQNKSPAIETVSSEISSSSTTSKVSSSSILSTSSNKSSTQEKSIGTTTNVQNKNTPPVAQMFKPKNINFNCNISSSDGQTIKFINGVTEKDGISIQIMLQDCSNSTAKFVIKPSQISIKTDAGVELSTSCQNITSLSLSAPKKGFQYQNMMIIKTKNISDVKSLTISYKFDNGMQKTITLNLQ